MDELDDELFGVSSRKSNLPQTSNPQPVIDFNEDDPLADLLSDDDFQTNSKVAGTEIKGSLVSDLFGLKSTDPVETNTRPKLSTSYENVQKVAVDKSADWLILQSTSPNKGSKDILRSRVPLGANNAANNEGTISSLPDKTIYAGEKTKKSSLMEDLFGSRAKSFNNNLQTSKDPVILGPEMTEIQKKSEQISKSSSMGYAPTLTAPRESRRGRRSSGGILDPLGMFSTPSPGTHVSATQSSEANTKETNGAVKNMALPVEVLPEWLGGSKKVDENILRTKKETTLSNTKSGATLLDTAALRKEENENPGSLPAESSSDYPEHLSVLAGNQFNQQAIMMSLQQQEHELRTAATLSRQSEQLNRMIESQKNRLIDQEKQFNILIKRQIDRQELLEVQMKLQQDRINSHLQVLLAQPSAISVASPIVDDNDSGKGVDEDKRVKIEFETIMEKVRAEKVYFENILDKLREQHLKQITIIEESYTRQIEVMNQGMVRLEKRLRQDAEAVEADYEAKIQKMREEQKNLNIAHGEEIENLKKEHMKRVHEMQDQQSRNIEVVQNGYIEAIENISRAKDIERQTISSATTQTTNLNSTLDIMKVTLTEIGEMKMRLEKSIENSNEAKELVLKQQIEELKDLKEFLKKQHESMESGRKELSESTHQLDRGALRLISEFDRYTNENTAAEKRLKSREEALTRDKELLDAQIQWERNHIQAMKETWIREQERQCKQLSEERNSLAAERVRLETLQRLTMDSNDTAKAEVEAALTAARDATSIANQERHKWHERMNEIQMQKQQIREKENDLTLRAKELQNLTQSALEKREEGFRALKEARYLEEQYKVHFGQLQIQSEALAQRENKLSTEKLTLARERLALRTASIDKPEKDIRRTNAPLDQYSHHPSQCNDLPDSQMTTTHFKDIVDPCLVLLKLGLDNELDVTNNCLGTMQSIAQ